MMQLGLYWVQTMRLAIMTQIRPWPVIRVELLRDAQITIHVSLSKPYTNNGLLYLITDNIRLLFT